MSVAILGDGGRIAKKLPGYEPRPQQLEMAGAVAAAFENGKHLLVEAGTGVGKSFAYLVPAIERVTRQGGRVVISTHTIALQEQLVEKDIPFLRSVFPEEFTAVLVKGRSNYIGLRRLARASAKQGALFDGKGQRAELWAIEDWAYKTTDGSLSDLPQQPGGAVWERVKSDADDCLGRKCPQFNACFYQRARRRAANAQLLIVNHALLFSDLAVRARGAAILPAYEYVVLDEAHTVERVAGDHLGFGTSNVQIRYLLNTLHSERTGRGVLAAGKGQSAAPTVREVRRVVEEYFAELLVWSSRQRNWNGRLREPPPVSQIVTPAMVELRDRLRDVREELQNEEDRLEFAGLIERCKEVAGAVADWHEQRTEGWVYWMASTGSGESGASHGAPESSPAMFGSRTRVTLAARPLDVGAELKAALFDKIKSAVLTSATLTTPTDDPFAYLRGRLGLSDATSLALGSPFDYRRQLTVHVEANLPEPSDMPSFMPAACEAIKKYTLKSAGRAFVLFTAYGLLRTCAERLADFFAEHDMPLLVQGSGMPRSLMLEKFRSMPRSVLFGTDTFWTGVDVPGEALSNVIIVKLPFAVPNEPMIEARIEQIRQAGGNPFMEFQVPEAVLKFRQGVGRLIRTKTDTGIVVILDPRVVSKPYGKQFLAALPDCEVVVEGSDRATERRSDGGRR